MACHDHWLCLVVLIFQDRPTGLLMALACEPRGFAGRRPSAGTLADSSLTRRTRLGGGLVVEDVAMTSLIFLGVS